MKTITEQKLLDDGDSFDEALAIIAANMAPAQTRLLSILDYSLATTIPVADMGEGLTYAIEYSNGDTTGFIEAYAGGDYLVPMQTREDNYFLSLDEAKAYLVAHWFK